MFIRFTPDGVVWPDGAKEPVDTILWATGYRRTFPYLNGSDTLDSDGRSRHHGGITTVPGLGFVGIEFQRSFSSHALRGVGRDAAYALSLLSRSR